MQQITELDGRTFGKTKSAMTYKIRPGLLMITDDVKRADKLKSMFGADSDEVAVTDSLHTLEPLLHRSYKLAIIDLAPANLLRALNSIREKPAYREMPIVVESSRLRSDPGFAGVLSKYRAMPCSLNDLVTLVRYYVACESDKPGQKPIL